MSILTNDELLASIETIKRRGLIIVPRQYSIVRLKDQDIKDSNTLIYLGIIPNNSEYCLVMDLSLQKVLITHAEKLVELTEEEL